jgi:predicted lipid-binding transport protein (Tim44 family)
MKNYSAFFTTLFITLSLTFAGISNVEAKRFGGARSFGGKSSYSSPFRRSTKSNSTRSPSQKKAFTQNKASRQAMSHRGGFMGMLGGLAIGGLLGALFFGGAFEGFNFMDILIFGGIAFILFRLFASKARRPMSYNEEGYAQYQPQPFSTSSQRTTASFDTDVLFDTDKKHHSSSNNDLYNDADFFQGTTPKGFDEVDFLTGAKGAFKVLQKAWDQSDLAEIRDLTTDKVFAEIQDQLNNSIEPNRTDVLKLNAELLSIRDIGAELEAVVLFDAIIKEDANSQAEQVREVWHFIKPKNSKQPKWYLDGIQQLEQ